MRRHKTFPEKKGDPHLRVVMARNFTEYQLSASERHQIKFINGLEKLTHFPCLNLEGGSAFQVSNFFITSVKLWSTFEWLSLICLYPSALPA